MVNLKPARIILNADTLSLKNLKLNIQEKFVLSVEAGWHIKKENMVNLKPARIILNADISSLKNLKLNIQEKFVLSVGAGWYIKKGDMVNLKLARIILNANTLRKNNFFVKSGQMSGFYKIKD